MHASVPVVVFQGNLLVSHHSIHRCSNNLQVRCHRYSNNLQVRCNNHSRGLSTHTDLALKTVPGLNPFPVEAVYTQGWSHLIYQSSVHLSLFVNVYPRLTVNALGEPADHFPLPAALRFPTESGWTAGAYCCDCSSGHGVGQVCGGRQTPTSGSLIPERDSPERRAAHLFWRHAAISGPASQASCVVAAVRIAPGTAPITARTERRDPQVQPSSPVQAAQTAPTSPIPAQRGPLRQRRCSFSGCCFESRVLPITSIQPFFLSTPVQRFPACGRCCERGDQETVPRLRLP